MEREWAHVKFYININFQDNCGNGLAWYIFFSFLSGERTQTIFWSRILLLVWLLFFFYSYNLSGNF